MERAPVLVRHGELQVLRQLPPGFRFHPTDEELVVQYLRRKALGFPLPAAVIPDVHRLHNLDPWDIPGASGGEKYFFAVRPTGGGRCGRPATATATATASGCWKPVGGREKPVVVASRCGGSHLVGVKKSMVFVLRGKSNKGGKAPRASPAAAAARRTDWVMHEYRLALPPHHRKNGCLPQAAGGGPQEWVVCRIFQRSRPPTRPDGSAAAARRTSTAAMSAAASSSSSCVTSSSDQEDVSSGVGVGGGGGHKQDGSS